jgi:histidine triad (HIT) family protein
VTACVFCQIAAGTLTADVVFRTPECIAFLDNRPLFPGHVLLIPREHYETLPELPAELAGALMQATQLLARAVENALTAQGSFIAINNRVSQSVPHVHIHVVPRRKGDGLKGFFWPRHKYQDEASKEAVRAAIERAAQVSDQASTA